MKYLAFTTVAELAYQMERKLTAEEILELSRRVLNFQKVREYKKVHGSTLGGKMEEIPLRKKVADL